MGEDVWGGNSGDGKALDNVCAEFAGGILVVSGGKDESVLF